MVTAPGDEYRSTVDPALLAAQAIAMVLLHNRSMPGTHKYAKYANGYDATQTTSSLCMSLVTLV